MPADARPRASHQAGGGADERAAANVAVVVPDVAHLPGSEAALVAAPSQWLGAICPYLRVEDGSWRSAVPAREHRCWAAQPASMLPIATQQELCLTAGHGACERFLHARDQRAAALAHDHISVGRLESARFGPFLSPVPIAVEARPAGGDSARRSASGRRRVPALLIGAGVILVGVAVLAVIFGGGRSPGVALLSPSPGSPHVAGVVLAATPDASPVVSTRPDGTVRPTALPARVGPSARATVGPTAPPTPTRRPAATPRPTPAPTPTVRPMPTVRPTPGADIARRYTVKNGDTIKSIANKFGLKPRDLRAVNDIGKNVVVGQRLRIPAGSVSAP